MSERVAGEISRPQRRAIRSPVLNLVWMRLRELWRQPATLFWVFGLPILLSIALGTAFHERGPEPIVVGAVRVLPPSMSAALEAAGVTVRTLATAEAERELRAGRVLLVLGPADNAEAPLEYRYDPTRTGSLLARATVHDAVQLSAGRKDTLAVNDRPVREIGSRYVDFLVPGILGMNLMTGALWGVGWSLADLRARKLLKRFRASPLRASQLAAGIAIARMLVIPIEAFVILMFARLAFGMPMVGSIALLALVLLAGSTAFSGIGVLVGSRANNGESAGAIINLAMLPMFIFSGVFFSASHFPDAVQPLIRLLPLTAINDAMRGVILEGAGLEEISKPLFILFAWAAMTLAIGLKRFRWN